MDQLAFTYRTDADAAAALLPAELEVEEKPRLAVLFVSYGFSSVGPFREWIQTINVRFRGEDINYVPHIFITNEAGMLAGREREGLPKLLADVDFDTGRVTPEGWITAQLSRPAGFMLARGVFRPSELVKDVSSAEPVVSKMLGLRVFGSAVPGARLLSANGYRRRSKSPVVRCDPGMARSHSPAPRSSVRYTASPLSARFRRPSCATPRCGCGAPPRPIRSHESGEHGCRRSSNEPTAPGVLCRSFTPQNQRPQ